MSGIVWAMNAGYSATRNASEVRTELQVHAARQDEVTNAYRDGINEIRAELKEQRRMIEDLWRKGPDMALSLRCLTEHPTWAKQVFYAMLPWMGMQAATNEFSE